MNNPTAFYLNPLSKNGKGKKKWYVIDDFDYKKVYIRDCSKTVSTIQRTEEKRVIAVGGDGTINLVLNGALLSKPKKQFGVLYSGTSPDFCKFHNIPIDEKKAISIIKQGEIKFVDVLYCENSSTYFASSCNIGLGAKVASTSNKIRKYFGDFIGTFISAVYAICTAKKFNLNLKLDNKTIQLESIYHLIILKNPFIASGLKLNLDIKENDGYLYIVAIKKHLIRSLFNLYKGKIPKDAFVDKGKKVHIVTTSRQQLEWDGDAKNIYTPVTIECKKEYLELIA